MTTDKGTPTDRLALDAGGLVEALVHLHTPTKTWGLNAKADNCSVCHETWPCETLLLVCEATGSKPPAQRMTACDGAVPTGDGGFRHCKLDRGHDGDCEDGHGCHGQHVPMRDALNGDITHSSQEDSRGE